MEPRPSDAASPAAWPATQWTLICQAGALPPSQRRATLEQLIAVYRQPLDAAMARLLRERGVAAARARAWAEELVQEFLTEKWVAGDMLSRLDRHGPARFKTFLYKCLHDFSVDALRRQSREHALHERLAEPARAPQADPFGDAERRFERTLALQDLAAALRETRDWSREKGWSATFDAFCHCLLGDGAPPANLPERTWRDHCARLRDRLTEAFQRRIGAACQTAEELQRELDYVERLLLDLRGLRWATLLDGELDFDEAG